MQAIKIKIILSLETREHTEISAEMLLFLYFDKQPIQSFYILNYKDLIRFNKKRSEEAHNIMGLLGIKGICILSFQL